ncbi:DUF262 domain-containing protein [Streptomyces triticirhizae]|uniref:DUF262 domain-containing protein n=1 Tax=Streptomyces triticirhizae TaxID=2483353 RepID=A0A3M2LRK5_9ACTN|nr:DUF262 domain-containing protein [Streptomyces triticirhizae]RMI39530.1 DUF262 domain-containing protein [Streptomyces triticirhizae]
MRDGATVPQDGHPSNDLPVELDDAGFSTDVEMEDVGERIDTPFNPELIEVQTRNPTVSLLLKRIRRGTLDLAPDFQRRAGIWNQKAQSRLIESLLLRITLPTLYAAEGEDDTWAVVDGIQRLSTIARFVAPEAIDNEPLRLTDLEYLTEFNGATFSDLPGRLQTRIEETELVVHLIRRGTPEEVKFNIFARINTGGRALSHQELRHALVPGPARGFLAELAASEEFKTATLGTVSPDRMADREMCLRFLAFVLTPPQSYTGGDLDDFLRKAMHRINAMSDRDRERLATQFRQAMDDSRAVFGDSAFRKIFRHSTRRSPVNKALFEAQSVTLSRYFSEDVAELSRRRIRVAGSYLSLMEDPQFLNSVSAGTGDVRKVRLRFESIDHMLREVLDD